MNENAFNSNFKNEYLLKLKVHKLSSERWSLGGAMKVGK